jgi:peptidoglycan/LPS O-acetylase OafA/YrhL
MPTMAAFILFGLGFRVACILENSTTLARWVTLLGTIDSFAVGALVAYLREAQILHRMWQSRTLLFAMPLIGCGCFYLGRAFMTLPEGNLLLALVEEIDAVFLAWVLAAALTGMKPVYARALSWAPLVYLGKISYGIYVYHVFIFVLLTPLLIPYGISVDHNSWGRVVILIAATILVASISWHWVEQPFLAWKKAMAANAGRKRIAPEPIIAQARCE